MKLYFQAGKHRLAIDTNKKTYNTNYYYLGAFHSYIEIKYKDYKLILSELDFNAYEYEVKF